MGVSKIITINVVIHFEILIIKFVYIYFIKWMIEKKYMLYVISWRSSVRVFPLHKCLEFLSPTPLRQLYIKVLLGNTFTNFLVPSCAHVSPYMMLCFLHFFDQLFKNCSINMLVVHSLNKRRRVNVVGKSDLFAIHTRLNVWRPLRGGIFGNWLIEPNETAQRLSGLNSRRPTQKH